MTNNLEIKGIGMVVWMFDAKDGTEHPVSNPTILGPGCKSKLLGTQKLFNKKQGMFGHYQGDEDIFRLFLNNSPGIEVLYDSHSGLPIGCAHRRDTKAPSQCELGRRRSKSHFWSKVITPLA
jgi:hypothetical protein